MRRFVVGCVSALILVSMVGVVPVGAKSDNKADAGKKMDPEYQLFEDSFTNETFHDCGDFQIGYDLDFLSELVTWKDRQLGRFEHHYEYWRSTDHEPLGVGDTDQTAVYDLGKGGMIDSYTILGPATWTLADGRTLEQSGAITFDGDEKTVWQDGNHPDFKAALCEVGEST